jgi:predicted ATPase
MAKKTVSASAPALTNRPPYMLIEEIRVQGYKSLVDATLHVRPLTLLAGTNSSGKSSIMQPLLLIKQTIELPYQPTGALVLNGAHVQAETAEELLNKTGLGIPNEFTLDILGKHSETLNIAPYSTKTVYARDKVDFAITHQYLKYPSGRELKITPDFNFRGIENQLAADLFTKTVNGQVDDIEIQTKSGFLVIQFKDSVGGDIGRMGPTNLINSIASVMHIPGLRGAPQRNYRGTYFKDYIKGTFDLYAAGTVSQWQEQQDTEKLAKLNDYLRRLGLTDSVTAKVKNANEVELSVSRLPAGSKAKPRKADMVNIADVGIGVSQVLPILVALIAAQEGQIVYVEQPELHLHPRAQVAMAELLAEAANRGVRVIVETHSSLLLLTVQTLIAQDKIKNTDVALHWFARDAKGATQVTYVQPDEDGAYGEWPEDFGDVELRAQDAYLTAVGERHFGNAGK